MVIIFFILGLIIGSFLNVVIYRLNLAESLLGRSHCPHCKKQINWYDNIPLLSFILLRGECRACKTKISWQYPLVEFFTGVLFACIGAYFFNSANLIGWAYTFYYLAIFSLLLVIFVYDFNYMEIPMLIFWIGVGVTLVFYLFLDSTRFASISSISDLAVFSGIIGGLIAFGFFFALAFFSKEKWMGMGDAYLGLLAGLIVGYPRILLTLVLAFFIGSLYSVMLLLSKKKTLKSQIPFAPFLVSAIILAIVLPKLFPILEYYYLFLFKV